MKNIKVLEILCRNSGIRFSMPRSLSDRRLHAICIILIFGFNVLPVNADKFSFEATYSLDDFEISYDENNHVHIYPKQDISKYWYGPENTPALPLYPYNYATSGSHSFRKLQITGKDSLLIASGVMIAPNPMCIPTDAESTEGAPLTSGYESKPFPENCVCFTSSSNWSDLSIFHFIVSPFEYDAQTGNLYLNRHMTVEFESDDNIPKQSHKAPSPLYLSDKSWDNPNYNPETTVMARTSNGNDAPLDYLIVTNNELKDTFKPLLDWKRTKGLKTGIVTVEEIETSHENTSSPLHLKIKEYLYDRYINEGVSYVLLGGDDKVVPTLKCYCYANTSESENMPVDMYYACFDGSFNWDANNNGIYGEINDSINFAPSIFVSRVPTRNAEQSAQYIKKVLEFETAPRWNNNILMAGTKRFVNNDSGQSDSEIQSEWLYECIAPLWNGQRVRLFDTCTDVEPWHFTREGLIDQISKGYGYIDIISHGKQTYWHMGENHYYSQQGSAQNNIGHSIVLTSACHTNAFDCQYDEPNESFSEDPCLSESLIRNYNSGIIAYWGSSRENWSFGIANKKYIDPSVIMEVPFYEYLFSSELKSKNFAKLITLAKFSNVQKAYSSGTYRWLQFSMNPMGDPEMCLYTTTPKTFRNMDISYSDNSISLKAGSDGCKICVMSADDSGTSFYKVFDDVSSVTLTEIPDYASICITKQDYIPKHFTVRFVQDITIDSDINIEGDIVRIGANANPTRPAGNVNFIGGNIIVEGKTIEVLEGVNIEKGAFVDFRNIK